MNCGDPIPPGRIYIGPIEPFLPPRNIPSQISELRVLLLHKLGILTASQRHAYACIRWVIHTLWDNIAYIGHFHRAVNPGRNDLDENQELYYPPSCGQSRP
jgi:hypothetical protein